MQGIDVHIIIKEVEIHALCKRIYFHWHKKKILRKYEFLGATVKTQAVSKMSESSGYMMLRMKPILPNGCSRNCNSSSCKEKKRKERYRDSELLTHLTRIYKALEIPLMLTCISLCDLKNSHKLL